MLSVVALANLLFCSAALCRPASLGALIFVERRYERCVLVIDSALQTD
jgi:hypothetical protein